VTTVILAIVTFALGILGATVSVVLWYPDRRRATGSLASRSSRGAAVPERRTFKARYRYALGALALLLLVQVILAGLGIDFTGSAGKPAPRPGISVSPVQPVVPFAALSDPDSRGVNAVAFEPDGQFVATADSNGSVYLWNARTQELLRTFASPDGSKASAIAFGLSGRVLAVGNTQSGVAVWNLSTGTLEMNLRCGGSGAIASLAFSAGGKLLAAAGSTTTGSVCTWVVSTEVVFTRFTIGVADISSTAFSPDSSTLAIGSRNGAAFLFGPLTHPALKRLMPSGGTSVNGMAFSPSGKLLAIGSGIGTLLVDVSDSKAVAHLSDPGRSAGVAAVAFSPNGTVLATADYNGSTYLWDVTSDQLTATLADPGSAGVTAVAFSPDGTTVALADGNGRTYLWGYAQQSTVPAIRRQEVLILDGNGTAYDLDSLAANWAPSSGTPWTAQNIMYVPGIPILDIAGAPATDVLLGSEGGWSYQTCADAHYDPSFVDNPNVPEAAALDPGNGICVETENTSQKRDGGHFALLVVLARTQAQLTLQVTIWQG
jgi:WD40 repeat protein